jgi:hypothetical protein
LFIALLVASINEGPEAPGLYNFDTATGTSTLWTAA